MGDDVGWWWWCISVFCKSVSFCRVFLLVHRRRKSFALVSLRDGWMDGKDEKDMFCFVVVVCLVLLFLEQGERIMKFSLCI